MFRSRKAGLGGVSLGPHMVLMAYGMTAAGKTHTIEGTKAGGACLLAAADLSRLDPRVPAAAAGGPRGAAPLARAGLLAAAGAG